MTRMRPAPDGIDRLLAKIESADAILIGAGAGLSACAGLTYTGERFQRYFADFQRKYGIADMYSGGFYPYDCLEEFFAWWSRHIYVNRYDQKAGKPYTDLLRLVAGRTYFVLTTNVDHQFQIAGFDRARLFYTQGDYGLWQCSKPCHQKTYVNEASVRAMVQAQKDMRVPTELIPTCPLCGAPMTVNLRVDGRFVQDEGWYAAERRYEAFVDAYRDQRILLLELGVGSNTPGIIKFPFWRMAMVNPKATYACINLGEAVCPKELEKRSILLDTDIAQALEEALRRSEGPAAG